MIPGSAVVGITPTPPEIVKQRLFSPDILSMKEEVC